MRRESIKPTRWDYTFASLWPPCLLLFTSSFLFSGLVYLRFVWHHTFTNKFASHLLVPWPSDSLGLVCVHSPNKVKSFQMSLSSSCFDGGTRYEDYYYAKEQWPHHVTALSTDVTDQSQSLHSLTWIIGIDWRGSQNSWNDTLLLYLCIGNLGSHTI